MQGREFELKFAVAADDVEALAAHPLLAAAPAPHPPTRLNATYFDTPERGLRARNISLRVRDDGTRRVQTLKQATASVVDRGEWEAEAEAATPSLDWIAGTPLKRAFRHGVGEALAPAFTVDVERTVFTLARASSEIEAALDRGTIRAGGASVPVREFELELKRGEPSQLFGLARDLLADVALMPSLTSKAERGYRLLDGAAGAPDGAIPLRLAPDGPVRAAAEAVSQACLRDVLAGLEGFEPDGDVETVHQGRVALRRLRAALTLFKPVLEDETFPRVRAELKRMSDLLGAARDLDVLQAEVFDPAAKDPAVLGGFELAGHMAAKRRDARAALAAGLRSRRWREAVLDLIGWLADGAWRGSEAAAGRLDAFVRPRLRRRWKRVVRAGADLEGKSPHERHLVRIAAKKLRYGLAFFEAAPGLGKDSKRYRALQDGLEDLQDALGQVHDRDALGDLLRAEVFAWDGAAGTADDRARFAAGLLAAKPSDGPGLLTEAAKAYRKVRKHAPF